MLPFDALDVVNSVDHMIDSVTSATRDAMLEMSTEDERTTLSSGSTLTREYAGKSPAAVSSSARSEFEDTQNGSSASSVTSASTTISTPVRDAPSKQSPSSAHCVPPPRKRTPHQKRRDRLVNPHRSISRSQKELEMEQGSREAAKGSAKVTRDKPTVVAVVRSKESDRRSKEQIEEQAKKLREMEKSEAEQVNMEFKKRSKEKAEEKEKKKFDKERKKWEEREQEERERQRNFDKERKKWEEREKREQARQRASKEKADQEQDHKEQEEAARKEKVRLEKERKKWEQREQVEKEREQKRDSREKERRSKEKEQEKEQADKNILVSAEPPRSMETDVSTSTPKSSTGSVFEVMKKGDHKLRLNNLSFIETGASRKSSESRANCINFHMPGEDPLEDTTVSAKSSSIHSLGVCPSRMVDRVFRATDNSAIIVLREYRNPADVKGLPNIDSMIPCNVSTTTTSVSQSTLTSRADSARSCTPPTVTAKQASPMPLPAQCVPSSVTVSARNVYSLSESEPSVPTDPRLYSPVSTPAVPLSTPRQAPPTLAPPPAPIDVMSLECKTIVRTEDGKEHCLHIAADGTAAKFNRVRVNGKTFLI